MTREEARKAAEVMLAYADGKDIEFKIKGEDRWATWNKEDGYILGFEFDEFDYRIKKEQEREPTYRPFKDQDECWAEMQKHQPFGWVLDGRLPKTLNCIVRNGAQLNDVYYIFEELFAIVTFADGTPFGIK